VSLRSLGLWVYLEVCRLDWSKAEVEIDLSWEEDLLFSGCIGVEACTSAEGLDLGALVWGG